MRGGELGSVDGYLVEMTVRVRQHGRVDGTPPRRQVEMRRAIGPAVDAIRMAFGYRIDDVKPIVGRAGTDHTRRD
jgi:hypothetical protein